MVYTFYERRFKFYLSVENDSHKVGIVWGASMRKHGPYVVSYRNGREKSSKLAVFSIYLNLIKYNNINFYYFKVFF